MEESAYLKEAEIARLEGEIRWALGASLEEVEVHMQSAIHVAQRQSAKSFELRAATSLACLWHRVGKSSEARRILVPAYEWFTEGLDTHDLRAAKALITELAAA